MLDVRNSAHVAFQPMRLDEQQNPTHGIGARNLQLGALLKIAHAISQELEKEDRPSIEVHLRSNIKGGPGTKQARKQAGEEAEEKQQGRKRRR